jgi:hypothetical protein
MNRAHGSLRIALSLARSARSLVAAAVAATMLAFLAVATPVNAQSPVAADPYKAVIPVRPATGGWFQPESNFGGLNFDISDSGVAAGNWSTYGENGVTSYYFQGTVAYPTAEQTQGNQITAVVESPLFRVISGNGCLTCTYVPAVLAPSGDNVRIEFTSSRSGRFILNNSTSIPITAWMQGLPLIAPRDYSGDWLAIVRIDYIGSSRPVHIEAVVQVRLEPLDGPETYHEIVASLSTSPIPVIPPQTDARRYRFSCIAPEHSCALVAERVLLVNPDACPECAAGEQFLMLWLNPNEAGQLGQARDEGANGYGLIRWIDNTNAYGEKDRILLRSSIQQNGFQTAVIREIELQRLPAGMFDADKLWQDGIIEAREPSIP